MKAPDRAIYLSVTCLGVSSIVTQIVALREFLNLFAGNELVFGLILGNWLLCTGVGSYVGRWCGRVRDPVLWLVWCQIGIALAPPLQIVAIRLLKGFFPAGFILGIGEVVLGSFLVLLPYCLLSGFLLTLFSGLASSRREASQIGHVYVLDVLGDIIGGCLFSFCLVYFLTPIQVAAFLLVLNLLAALVLTGRTRRVALAVVVLGILAAAVGVLGRLDLETITSRAMFPGQELLGQQTTPYGHLAVTRQGQQVTLYQNGVPVGVTADPAAAEETVHYALAQHPKPRTALLLSGGLTGALDELEKYGLDRVDYVELDPAVLALVREIRPAAAARQRVEVAQDARRFVQAARGEYDAILMSLPDPAAAQLNRFYTVEFFQAARRALRPGGVLSLSLSSTENYANPEARRLASGVHRALSSVFTNILLIPGERLYFVAANGPLDYALTEKLRAKGVRTRYVHEDYLGAKLTPERLAGARKLVGTPVAPNRDFHPTSYHAHLRFWLSQFGGSLLLPMLLVLGVVLGIGMLLAGSPRPRVAGAICASGFAGIGLEVVLLIAFQVCYGHVYRQVGLMVTAFLVGAAVGAGCSGRRSDALMRRMFLLEVALAGLAFVLVPVLQFVHGSESSWLQTWAGAAGFCFLTGLVGWVVGAQFPMAARLSFVGVEQTAGQLYALDLLGACLGALLVGTLCIPSLGLTGTCYLIGALKLASAVLLRRGGEVADGQMAPVAPAASQAARLAFGTVLFIFAAVGLTVVAEDANVGLYAVALSPVYHGILVLLLGWGILQAMGVRGISHDTTVEKPGAGAWRRVRAGAGEIHPWRWIYYAAFALVAFLPVFRCYFKVPYLFCHVCPRPCVFGVLRPYLVPAALVMNLEKRHWCYRVCPIGTLYHCQMRAGTARGRSWPRLLRWVPWLALAFTVITYFKLRWDLAGAEVLAGTWYTYFFTNAYAVSATVVILAVLLLALGYRWRRTFCDALCPIGTFSELLLKWERVLILERRRTESDLAPARPEPLSVDRKTEPRP